MSRRTSIHGLTFEQLQALDKACSMELAAMSMYEPGREAMELAREKVREALQLMGRK